MNNRARGLFLTRTLAMTLILAQAAGGSFCKRNAPAGSQPKGGTITSAVEEEDPEASASYKLDVPDLGPIGPITLADVSAIGPGDSDTILAEARAVIDSALLEPDLGDRYLAIDGMINLPWGWARPWLEAALKDPDQQVVMLALQQLAHQGDPDTKALLEPYLAWDDLWRRNDAHPMAYRPRQDFITDESPIEMLARMGVPAVEPIIREKLTSADDVTSNIMGIRLAERYGPKQFVEELATLFNMDPNASQPYHAARLLFLYNLNADSAERFLKKGLDPARMLPSIIVTGMTKELKRRDWEPELRGLLKSPDATVRGQALEALGLLGLPINDMELQVVLQDYDARGRILSRVQDWADPKRMIPLLEGDSNPTDQDYYIVQLALARMGSEAALERLIASSRQRTSDHIWDREALVALNALAELQHPRVVQQLMDALNSPDPPVRVQYACLQGLGRHMDPASLPTLVRYYRNYSAAQPGLAAYAAEIAAALVSPPDAVASQSPESRLIWPIPAVGRFEKIYEINQPGATGGAGS